MTSARRTRDEHAADGEHLGACIAATMDSRLVAMCLRSPPSEVPVHADSYGGLADMLSDRSEHGQQPDVDRMDEIATHPCATVGAIVATQSVREAARRVGMHHRPLSTRAEVISTVISIEVPVHD